MRLELELDDSLVENIIKDYTKGTILSVYKKEGLIPVSLGFVDIERKFGISRNFLIKEIYWKEDHYSVMLKILKDILEDFDYISREYPPSSYFRLYRNDLKKWKFGSGDIILGYYKKEEIVKRWLLEKF